MTSTSSAIAGELRLSDAGVTFITGLAVGATEAGGVGEGRIVAGGAPDPGRSVGGAKRSGIELGACSTLGRVPRSGFTAGVGACSGKFGAASGSIAVLIITEAAA